MAKSPTKKPVNSTIWKHVLVESLPLLIVGAVVLSLFFLWDDITDWLEDDIKFVIGLGMNAYNYILSTDKTPLQKLMLVFSITLPLLFGLLLRKLLFTVLPQKVELKNFTMKINEPNQRGLQTNGIKTTRYSKFTLIPLVLLEQMTKPDNIYFEIVCYIQVMYPELSPTGRHSTYPGLVLTYVWKMVSIAVEQIYLWYEDMNENIEPYRKLTINNEQMNHEQFHWVRSEDIRQGDIILISEDENIPVDGIALASSDSLFQVNMSLLNGEISPYKKYPVHFDLSPVHNQQIHEQQNFSYFKNLRGNIVCTPSTHLLDVFNGSLYTTDKEIPFSVKNAVYRGTKMKGTDWILVYVIYTGPLTKIGKCFKSVSLKQTSLDNKFFQLLKVNFMLLGSLIVIATIVGIFSGKVVNDFQSILIEGTVNFLHLNGLNNLSSQIMADMVRIGQRRQIIQDRSMSCLVNRKDVLDEIVDELVTDKTGTLTENSLVLTHLVIEDQLYSVTHHNELITKINNNELIKAMSFCHDVTPRNDEMLFSTVEDLKFMNAAKQYGFHLLERSHNSVTVAQTAKGEMSTYDILQFNEFESRKKHMSVILQQKYPDGTRGPVELWFKGADIETIHRRDPNNSLNSVTPKIQQYTHDLSNQGLRVLLWAKRTVPFEEYKKWSRDYQNALKLEVSVTDKQIAMDQLWNSIETNLTIIGATAIEDKIQPGANSVLRFCQDCGIKISVATGDSENTAVAIMKHLGQVNEEPCYLTSDPSKGKEEIDVKINRILSSETSKEQSIVIDGKTLAVLNSEKYREKLKKILPKFKTRIFARVSAIQKAEIVILYKEMGKRCFAVGDGGNDVTMIQEANFGVGIRGIEGHQAASAADFQITRFQEIQTVLAHSLRSHIRLASVYLWNDYKAVLIALVAYLSRSLRGFTGDALIPGEIIFTLNTFDLSYPIIMFGIVDDMIPFGNLVREPEHYKIGQELQRYNLKRKLLWWSHAFIHAFIIVGLSRYFLSSSTSSTVNSLVIGVSAGQIISVAGNVRMFLETRRFNWTVFISAVSSALFLTKFARYNPFGSKRVPKINLTYVLLTSFLCLIVDLLLLSSFDVCSIFRKSYWKSVWEEWTAMGRKLYEYFWNIVAKGKENYNHVKDVFGVKGNKTKRKTP